MKTQYFAYKPKPSVMGLLIVAIQISVWTLFKIKFSTSEKIFQVKKALVHFLCIFQTIFIKIQATVTFNYTILYTILYIASQISSASFFCNSPALYNS